MKHWAAFAFIAAALAAALVWSEVRKVDARVGPEPILSLIGDSERELTRLPVAFAPLPDAEEIKIGKELEKSYSTWWHRDGEDAQNRAVEQYLQQVGAKVAAHAHRKLPYRFHYVPSMDFINAFALPGGPVFVGGGLMALMDTEDELAAVIGHEIEHIDHYHCAERIQVEAALRRVPLGGLIGLPVEVFVAGYSKTQELEADREGTKLAAAAMYSPQGAIHIFQAFERVYPTKTVRSDTPPEELSKVALETLEGYFRSHPLNAERIDQIQKMIAGGQLPGWTRTTPFPLAYIFVTERAWRSLQAARVRPYPFLTWKEKQKREAERVKQYEEARKLTSQSLELKTDQPRATEILAISQFALGDYPAAVATYSKLLPDYPTFADGVRLYADALAEEALETQQYDKAAKLAKQSLQLQPNQPETLKLLAKVQFWISDFAGAAETCRKLKNMYPVIADQLRVYADGLAASFWAQHKYEEAAKLAALSLDLNPGQAAVLATLAKAQFALANFQAAAAAYRQLLELNISDAHVVRGFADSLSASDLSARTARDFEAWTGRIQAVTPALATDLRVEAAGLMAMTGNDAPAKALISEAQEPGQDSISPESLGRLGWWYYRAGNYEMSRGLLRQALVARPGNSAIQVAVAWNELEQHQFDIATRHFTASFRDTSWNSPIMGRALAHWQARRTADALGDFESVTRNAPEWRNPRWVSALFPASVAQDVVALDAEWQKRQTTRR
ncbi:MAG TPA: M48 family metalloprotease [Bryobacteraceae bacterium]|nr:M48 family metalloprotease [Bryobacteraceae bacterium]